MAFSIRHCHDWIADRPSARARFVVTLPPAPSHVGQALEKLAGSAFVSLTDTKDAFLHLAKRAKERFIILTPFIDAVGAAWASDLFSATDAKEKILVVRESALLDNCGSSGERLKTGSIQLFDYVQEELRDGQVHIETFHAKIVLADGIAAYVGSAKLLYLSRELNLECGFLLDGDAVAPVAILVDAVLLALRVDRLDSLPTRKITVEKWF